MDESIQKTPAPLTQCQSWMNQGLFHEAIEHLVSHLELNPSSLDIKYWLANCYFQIEDYQQAKSLFKELYTQVPDNNNVVDALWKTYYLHQDYQEAINFYQKAEAYLPKNHHFFYQLAQCFEHSGQVDNAIIAYQYALQHEEVIDTLMGYADQLKQALRLEESCEAFKRTIQLEPDEPSHYINTGTIYSMLGDNETAIHYFLKAFELNPNIPSLANKITHAYLNAHKGEEAKRFIENLLVSKPMDPEILFCRGQIDKVFYLDHTSASICYQKASQALIQNYQNGNISYIEHCSLAEIDAIMDYFNHCMDNCEWETMTVLAPIIRTIIQHGVSNKTPLPFNPIILQVLYPAMAEQKDIFSALSSQYNVGKNNRFTHFERENNKIRVGYLSPDLRQHVVGFILKNFIGHHDESYFDVYCYSLSPKTDNITEIIKQKTTAFKSLVNLSHAEAARIIHEDKIDILIDLAGYTEYAQPQILSYRPAPIQVQYLGYSGTMATDFYDYYMTSEPNTPSVLTPYFNEMLAYLPESLTAVEPVKNTALPSRQDYGLQDDQVVFAAFTVGYRINQAIFSQWLSILAAVPNSVLWLNSLSEQVMENLKEFAEKFGIDPNRLVFRTTFALQPNWEIQLADVYLDTSPFSGMTASIYALWFGVPLVTTAQNTFHSNFSTSCLHQFGLNQLIAHSPADYQSIAIDLGLNNHKRLAFKKTLLEKRHQISLYNPKQFVTHLEQLYKAMINAASNTHKQNPLSIEVLDQ